MTEFLKNLIAAKEKRAAEIKNLIAASQNIDEVRSLGAEQTTINQELIEARTQLAKAEADEAQVRSTQPTTTLNPVAMYGVKTTEARGNENPLASMEYRTAFMNYVQKGTPSELLKRSNAEGTSADLGVLLPETIVQEIIKGVESVYGQLYAKVRKLNVQGGVKFPIGSFTANLVWGGTGGSDTEHGVSEKQDAGGVTSYVSFTYNIGEIRIAQSLLQSVLSVPLFEQEITKALIEAYVKAMDLAILDGAGTNQPVGIFANTSDGIQRITALTGHVISFTANEMANWADGWQKKFFAKLPLSMRSQPYEFVMTSNTFEGNIETLQDSNGQPVAKQVFDAVAGDLTAKFKGKEVTFIEEGTSVKNFDDATNNQYFGFAWVPNKAYGINSNMQFGYKKYFDEDTNQWISKGLVIVDGKIIDPKYIYLFKKSA